MNEGSRKRATIHDVARVAGVSAATVSKLLHGVTTIKAENVKRIREAIEDLDYRVDPLAAGLRNERRRIIGVIVPDLESSFFGALVTVLEKAAEAAGYSMIVTSSRESEEREAVLVERMRDWSVAGTVLIPVRSERGAGAQKLRDLKMRAVLVDRVSADDQFDTICADNINAAAQVAQFLVGAGHSHFLVHGYTRQSKALRTRLEGFSQKARELDGGVKITPLLSDNDLEAQRHTLQSYFAEHIGANRPTAVFALEQHSTMLVLSELRRLDISVPDEVALVGFDDAQWMQLTFPTVTAVAQPVACIAGRSIETLLKRIEGRESKPAAQWLETCTLKVRQSTGLTLLEGKKVQGV